MNLNDLRMSLKAALDNMWARITSMFSGLDERVTDLEEGGGDSYSESSFNPSDWLKNINAKVTQTKVERYGNVIYISFTLAPGLTNSATLFEFNDASIKPRANNMVHIWPIFIGSSGAVFANGGVWIERNQQAPVYYGTTLTEDCYCMMSYIV